MITPEMRSPDQITRVALLGVRFWDVLSGTVVDDGLRVTAYPRSEPRRRVRASANRKGVFMLHEVPGLPGVEGIGTAPGRSFVVEVRDEQPRFHAFTFAVELPAPALVTVACESPPLGIPGVPLYSAPTRAVPDGMAVVRARLWDPVASAPAAWAMIEASVRGRTGRGTGSIRGIADRTGGVALMFPYPEPAAALGSPPGSGTATGGALGQQEWTLDLRARYTRRRPPADIPDLCDVTTQSPAELWAEGTVTSGTWVPRAPFTHTTLRFGEEMVLRSTDVSSGKAISDLWITVSPP